MIILFPSTTVSIFFILSALSKLRMSEYGINSIVSPFNDFFAILHLSVFLSAWLAIFNVLPFPPLDGGLLLFTLIEWVARRQVSFRVQDWVTKAGFALLMLLMVFVMYNDLANLAFFEKIKDLIHR